MATKVCQLIFGEQRGEAIHQLVEQSLGEACPCLQGKPCVLVDENGETPLLPFAIDQWEPSPAPLPQVS